MVKEWLAFLRIQRALQMISNDLRLRVLRLVFGSNLGRRKIQRGASARSSSRGFMIKAAQSISCFQQS
jgi:hypothetical protein